MSVMAQQEHAVMIDCSNNSVSLLPFHTPDLAVLVVDTGKRHALVDGEYAQRRASCYSAAKKLSVDSLRDASMDLLEQSE